MNSAWGAHRQVDGPPTIASLNNHLLGGRDCSEADRLLTANLRTVWRGARASAVASHDFALRAAVHMTRGLGIGQFLVLGAGAPVRPYLHDAVQDAAPGARLGYTDPDPVAVVLCGSVKGGQGLGRIACVNAQLTSPGDVDALLTRRQMQHIDWSRPVGVIASRVFEHCADTAGTVAAAHRLRDCLAPGSAMAVAHITADTTPFAIETAVALYEEQGLVLHPRALPEVAAYLAGYTLLGPIVSPGRWAPPGAAPPTQPPRDTEVCAWAGVGVIA